MMEFKKFAEAVNDKFTKMSENDMFIVDISGLELSEKYLEAFPKGSNPIFIEKTEHDCQICKQFIRFIGMAISLNTDSTYTTVWNVEGLEYPYNEVATKMDALIKSLPIKSIFLHNEKLAGRHHSVQLLESGKTREWNHFWAEVPEKFYNRDLDTIKAKAEGRFITHERSLQEISVSGCNIVIDLIESESLYRGTEHLEKVRNFLEMKQESENFPSIKSYAWATYKNPGAGIRSTVIGNLLQDVTEGRDLTEAVKSFEDKVAPANYKRSKSIVTERMMKEAIKVIDGEGIRTALSRRQAIPSDISVNDILFTDRSVKLKDSDPLMGMLEPQKATEIKGLDNAPEITMEEFISNVLPTCSELNLVSAPVLQANKVQLSAPVDPEAKSILQWNNNFSWSYAGNMADSDLTKKVVAAGGRVDGVIRFTHSWNRLERNESLMDLHVFMPGNTHRTGISESYGTTGNRVGWNLRTHGRSGGTQDVDYTDAAPIGYVPVENITFPDLSKLPDGDYQCKIHNWSFRGTGGKGEAEIAINGQVFQYVYPATKNHQWIDIATVHKLGDELTITHHITPTNVASGMKLEPITMMMLSPNHWKNTDKKGNKHYFFVTGDEQAKEPFRGYYGEFLSPKYHGIRKSLDLLASKMQCDPVEEGIHGYGFSETQHTALYIKADNKMYKVVV